MNAPKKIWWNSEEDKADEYSDYGTGTVSYIRADIVDDLVKALNGVIAWDKTRNFLIPYCVRDPIHTALAKLEKEELREESHD